MDKKRKQPARWRKSKPEKWTSNRDQRELWRGNDRLAIVNSCEGGWYWYGGGRNSLNERAPYPTQKAAMDAARKELAS